jgi:hypothetical protein
MDVSRHDLWHAVYALSHSFLWVSWILERFAGQAKSGLLIALVFLW